MAEKSSASFLINQNENLQLAGQPKETTLGNTNLIALNREFGKDISNIRTNQSNSNANNASDKQEISINDQGNIIELKNPDIQGNSLTDPSMVDLPKQPKEPLMASRELLVLRPVPEKVKDIQPQPKRLQKVPLNLSSMENCDILEINNPQYCSVYAKEIFENLQADEIRSCAQFGGFSKTQTDINEKMRAVLIDWLVEIHMKFRLQNETLHLAVNLVDRYLEKVNITKQKLQLVGVASMLIASKYQEIYPPEIKDFIYAADKTYKKEEILEMEGDIISTLQFIITVPTSLVFLERFNKLANLDKKTFYLAQYICELALVDYNMLKYSPSTIARGSILMAVQILKIESPGEILARNHKQDEDTMKICGQDLLRVLKNAEKSNLKAVRTKFVSTTYMEVANIQINIL